jgi:signal transduction histidine kinase
MRLQKLRDLTRSFSFRMGAILFFAICTSLMSFRVVIYYESVAAAYEDTQAIIDAHAQEIEEAVTRYGITYVKILIREIVHDTPDKRLYLAFRDKDEMLGNIGEWPVIKEIDGGKWQEIAVPQGDRKKPLRLLVKTLKLKKKSELIIGYDLYRIVIARESLLVDMAQNIVISLAVSFWLSVIIIWLINRQFLRINRTCEAVIQGGIARRVPVRRAGDQFDILGHHINRMLDWITTLLGTVRESSNAIAHDMRTPLSFHRLELQALADNPAMPEMVRQKMRESVARVDALVEMFDNLLNISKAESRSSTEIFSAFDLAEAARDIAEFYAPLCEEKNLSVNIDIPRAPVTFTGDEQLLKQAIVNLLDNAIKYTPAGGTIWVMLHAADKSVALTVADNGPGIPADFREKAKQRFFRVDESRNTQGSGLGLSLVNAVAGLHQGALLLEDHAPGLRATLVLPVK